MGNGEGGVEGPRRSRGTLIGCRLHLISSVLVGQLLRFHFHVVSQLHLPLIIIRRDSRRLSQVFCDLELQGDGSGAEASWWAVYCGYGESRESAFSGETDFAQCSEENGFNGPQVVTLLDKISTGDVGAQLSSLVSELSAGSCDRVRCLASPLACPPMHMPVAVAGLRLMSFA